VRAAGEHLDIQRQRVLPVDPVANAAQPREIAQVLRCCGSAGHLRDHATLHLSEVDRADPRGDAGGGVPRQLLDGHRRGGMGGLRPVAACSPTLVSIMATSCLANVGLRGGRVALIPAKVILRRRECLTSRKASPRSGVGGQPFFDVARPRACWYGDHCADNAGLAWGRRHRGEVCYEEACGL
jgi:hypothetical protein